MTLSPSSSEESVVLVEHEDGTATTLEKELPKSDEDAPHAVNIVSIGTETTGYAFRFHPERLQAILAKVPSHYKVKVVSVVGAFRTGKSFLLSWFLRYINRTSSSDNKKWYEQVDELQEGVFHWQAGKERDTTGIWMWNTPVVDEKDESVLFLVDTQGMFDHETSMNLTACIFGFSTLLSSYQVYNVDKRIQEDNLQQLALFSEYAVTAMEDQSETAPFQMLEFLVRDWQHYDEEEEDNVDRMEESMKEYLDQVIRERDVKDLQETREQILNTFQNIQCYGLCHPGFAVTKKKFAGQASDMEPLFLRLLDRYCTRVFDAVPCKQIHGQTITVTEFGNYCKAYAGLFAQGAKFPQAATLLDATATANTTNAKLTAMQVYTQGMDRTAGPHCTNYVPPQELQEQHELLRKQSIKAFQEKANFGNKQKILEAKNRLEEELSEQFTVYESLNNGRNPLLGLEVYVIPGLVAAFAYVLRWFTDATCSHTVCRATSEALHHTWTVVTCFLLIVGATKFQQLKAMFQRIQQAVGVLLDAQKEKKE
ncbi:hypothetical protein FisN_23Hh067 [Fistulifera solaris]|uniref:GB1/RHD3-type G domain-containing protein n=1 Tax=Fistulifera solaris TaxID=1519565 RepID=A0A1Z5KNG5_FISSO|nr:hypothetical protein FisN_23Hh067 [Fistulifera solaris]|eukprot:GAX27468.1 hypothetical protein FisN_23Hh067 [Fistulifera solaris]